MNIERVRDRMVKDGPAGWAWWDRAKIPDAPGCYAVYRDDQLVYIGSACNLRARFKTYRMVPVRPHRRESRCLWEHNTPFGPLESLTIKLRLSTRFGDWLMRELRLISRLNPPQNIANTIRHSSTVGMGGRSR